MTAWPERLVLLGHPVDHSLSPALQNAALAAADIPLEYEPLDTPRSALEQTMATLRLARAAGNVTIPHKEAVLRLCDRLTETARAVGAVNTFWVAVDGALVGDNTDAGGFDAAVRALVGTTPANATIAVLGAGGAAAAVMHALERWPNPRVRLYNRTTARALALVSRFNSTAEYAESAELAVKGATIVINATSVGLRDGGFPVAVDALSGNAVVLDLVYGPRETPLVRGARARGLRAMDGLTLLVEQGALAFERWFGMTADREAMWQAVRSLR